MQYRERTINAKYPEIEVMKSISYVKDLNLKLPDTDPTVAVPFSTVIYREEEDNYYVSGIYNTMEDYFLYDINKYTGLSYKEYKQLTPEEQKILIDFVINKIERLNKELEELDKESQETNLTDIFMNSDKGPIW